jgi:hypothetical protein
MTIGIRHGRAAHSGAGRVGGAPSLAVAECHPESSATTAQHASGDKAASARIPAANAAMKRNGMVWDRKRTRT